MCTFVFGWSCHYPSGHTEVVIDQDVSERYTKFRYGTVLLIKWFTVLENPLVLFYKLDMYGSKVSNVSRYKYKIRFLFHLYEHIYDVLFREFINTIITHGSKTHISFSLSSNFSGTII